MLKSPALSLLRYLKTIRQRQKNWIEHALRGDSLLRDMMEWRVMERKRTGKPRKGMVSGVKEVFNKKKDEKSDPGK